MKCPKCGFVSYPGIPQCKKCGHSFFPAKPKEETPQTVGLFSSPPSPPAEAAQSLHSLPGPPSPAQEEPSPPATPPPAQTSSPARSGATAFGEVARPGAAARPLQEELSERVEDFRRRRARLRGDVDPNANLEFDFQGEPGTEATTALDSKVIEFPQRGTDLDVFLEKSDLTEAARPGVDSLSLDQPARHGSFGAALVDAGDYGLETETAPSRPVEIVLDSQPLIEETEGSVSPQGLSLAPLSRRFLGGLVDALVLMVAAGLFALIFWRAGGRLSAQPLNLVVVAFIVVVFIMSYFGIFTALTSTTPGLLWVGIEVRSQNGAIPTTKQAFWRAFGYLVSISALMLGFVWALVDSDGLTWHDRMSDTFLTDADIAVDSRQSTVDS